MRNVFISLGIFVLCLGLGRVLGQSVTPTAPVIANGLTGIPNIVVGTITANGTSVFTNAYAGSNNDIGWASRTRLQSAASGRMTMMNLAGDAGVQYDVTTNGQVQVRTLDNSATGFLAAKPPTSCTGLSAGTLWNNGGTPAICP